MPAPPSRAASARCDACLPLFPFIRESSLPLLFLFLSSILFLSFFLHDDPRVSARDARGCAPRPPRREARGGQRGAHGVRRAARRERAAPRAERVRDVRGRERHQDRPSRRGRRARFRGDVRRDGPLEAHGEERRGRAPGCSTSSIPGLAPTNRDLLSLMVAISDNTAANRFIDLFGKDAVNARMATLGLPGIRLVGRIPDRGHEPRQVGAARRHDAPGHGRVLPPRRDAHADRPGRGPPDREAPCRPAHARPPPAASPRAEGHLVGGQDGELRRCQERLAES